MVCFENVILQFPSHTFLRIDKRTVGLLNALRIHFLLPAEHG